jgi:hypothetical protein
MRARLAGGNVRGAGSSARSRVRLRTAVWSLLLPLAAVVAACTPSAEDCHDLMPLEVGPAVPAPTPAGTRGCKATQDGVAIQVEAVRRNLSWERGRIWVDGIETPESDLQGALTAARARQAAAKANQILRGIKDTARSIRDTLRGQEPPPKPPQPQP